VPNLKVDPAYLDALKGQITTAKTFLDTGFKATGDDAGWPDKFYYSHGLTASHGHFAMMDIVRNDRAALQKHLADCLTRLNEALEAAKVMYGATDHSAREALDKQMNPGG
jgi:hypothetical protein